MTQTPRLVARTATAALLALALMLGLAVAPANATQDVSAEQQFVALINADRAASGLQTLTSARDVRDVAYDWAVEMANARQMTHNPVYHEQFCCWLRAAENVGWTSIADPNDPDQIEAAVDRLHVAFMNSEGHRANIMHPAHDQIGVGVEIRLNSCPSGTGLPHCVWVTENFRHWDGTQPAGGLQDPYASGTGDTGTDKDSSGSDAVTDVTISDEVHDGGFDGNDTTVERLGATADSAVQVSQARFPATDSATHAVLSRDDRFPDSLAGTPLTADGPLLFTPTSALTNTVRDELKRALPNGGTVYLLGGEAALSEAVEDAVRHHGFTPVRLAGADRLETSMAVADEVRRLYGDTGTVAIARAWGPSDDVDGPAAWVDSITGGAWAADKHVPVLVSRSDRVTSGLDRWLRTDAPNTSIVFGGAAALSDQVLHTVPNGVRISGADRTATATAVAEQLWGVTNNSADRQFIVIDGWNRDGWKHGLAAAGLAADASAPMLLARGDRADQPSQTTSIVRACSTPQVDLVLVGALIDAVAGTLESQDGMSC